MSQHLQYLRSDMSTEALAGVGVDMAARVIRGYVVAQEGPFKSGRGRFTGSSLAAIADQINAAQGGLKSRFTHPTASNDGLGRFLGRAKNARIDGGKVRADLHLSASASMTPEGDLGGYVMRLAAEDPAALSSSLVLTTEKIEEMDGDGRPVKDGNGKPLPPIWMPRRLHASDIVDTGDACDDLLSLESPFELPWVATEALDRLFRGQSRSEIQRKATEWLNRYLDLRFGVAGSGGDTANRAADLRKRIAERSKPR